MSQSKRHSALETAANVAIGYVVALAAQILIFPLFGVHVAFGQNIAIGIAFTVVSIVRSYCLRRAFNAWHARTERSREVSA